MNHNIITLETAKLAKEKGFNLISHAFYGCDEPPSGVKGNQLILRDWENWTNFGHEDSQDGTLIYSAPTQHLLQKWLREVHNIHINPTINLRHTNLVGHGEEIRYYCIITFYDEKYGYGVKGSIYRDIPYDEEEQHQYKTYEEALEVGLINGLKLIK